MGTFVNYLKDPTPLEQRLKRLFRELGISKEDRRALRALLSPLRNKGLVYRFHYDHTLRVTFLCVAVAKFMHLSEKTMLYAGLLHDIGKAQVPIETLGKTSGWTNRDTKAIRPHVMDGYRLVRGRFDFSAEIILWHHRFQSKGYPVKMPRCLHKYCLGTKVMIPFFGRIISLCDQYDAFHRVNDRQGTVVIPTGDEIEQLMLKANPDHKPLIEELYNADIFTTYIEGVEE